MSMIQFGVKLLRWWEERDLSRVKLLTSSEANGILYKEKQVKQAIVNIHCPPMHGLIKPVARLAETRRLTDLKGQLAKQTGNIDQIIKILKPLQKYITTTERQFKSIKQIEGQIKQLQKQTLDILKIVRKIK